MGTIWTPDPSPAGSEHGTVARLVSIGLMRARTQRDVQLSVEAVRLTLESLSTLTGIRNWVTIFNNDATLASAVLDPLLHHHEHVIIEGNSYRMMKTAGPMTGSRTGENQPGESRKYQNGRIRNFSRGGHTRRRNARNSRNRSQSRSHFCRPETTKKSPPSRPDGCVSPP